MKSARYYQNKIHCTCGESFHNGLETRLSDELWEDRFDSEASDHSDCVCPRCGTQYRLTVTVEMTVETRYTDLESLGQIIESADGLSINLEVLQGRWIGDRIVLEQGDGFEDEKLMPDGVYVTGDKEYQIQDGIVMNYWGIPDENQLSLFEESLL